jgi:hypothetical protein
MRVGRAISQAVSRRLLTVAVPIRSYVTSCGICGGQSGTGAGFLLVLQFLLPKLMCSILISPGTGTIGQLLANVPSGLSLTPPPQPRNKKMHTICKGMGYVTLNFTK